MIRPRFVAITAIFVFFAALGATWANDLARQVQQQRTALKKTQYPSRPPEAAKLFLGPIFSKQVKALRPHEHWIEAGSAGMSAAVAEYLGRNSAGATARVTSIGLEPMTTQHSSQAAFLKATGHQYDYRGGRFIEQYRPGEIALANLITDQYGPIAYTNNLAGMFRTEGKLLAPKGLLLTHVTRPLPVNRGLGSSSNLTRVCDSAGKDVLQPWLQAIRGLRLVYYSKTNEFQSYDLGFQVVRIGLQRATGSICVPELQNTGFIHGHPPQRLFVWDGAPAK